MLWYKKVEFYIRRIEFKSFYHLTDIKMLIYRYLVRILTSDIEICSVKWSGFLLMSAAVGEAKFADTINQLNHESASIHTFSLRNSR